MKFNLYKLDRIIVYELIDNSMIGNRIHRFNIANLDNKKFTVYNSESAKINESYICLGRNTDNPSNKITTFKFQSNEERDLYYDLYINIIKKVCETYKEENGISQS